MSKAVLVNYNHDPKDWWLEYGYKPEDVTIYDRSDDGVEHTFAAKTYKTKNVGNVDYDKLGYLIENYYNLPDVFLWGKTNLFKYITKEEWELVKDRQEFTPLLTKNHATYMDNSLPDGGLNPVSMYDTDGMYYERHGIVDTLYQVLPWRHYKKIHDFWADFNIKPVGYIPFPPGGNFILTRERVHRYGVDYYERMRNLLDYAQTPLEAQMLERSYFLIWR